MRTMLCPVCRNATFDPDYYENDVCIECGWEYDTWQMENPFASKGEKVSLEEYRHIYLELSIRDPNFSCRNGLDRELIESKGRKNDY